MTTLGDFFAASPITTLDFTLPLAASDFKRFQLNGKVIGSHPVRDEASSEADNRIGDFPSRRRSERIREKAMGFSDSKAAHSNFRSKTHQNTTSQELHHSASVLDPTLQHKVLQESKQPKVEIKQKLKFPSANDPIWKVVNTQLEQDLKHFNISENLNGSLERLDSQVYDYLESMFGTQKAIPKKVKFNRKTRALERIRKEKQLLKKEWRNILRKGTEHSQSSREVIL